MTNQETFQALANIDALSELDDLTLSTGVDEANIRIGVASCLFYEGGATAERRVEANGVLRDYRERFDKHLTHYHPMGARRHRPFGKVEPIDYYDKRARTMGERETYGAGLYGFDGGRDDGNAPRHYIANIGRARRSPFSDVTAYLPVSTFATRGWNALIDLVLEWCALLCPAHGTAGLGLLPDTGNFMSHLAPIAFPGLRRHPGLDWPHTGAWALEAADAKKRHIRTVNWLTVLDEAFVDALGGPARVRDALGAVCAIHEWRAANPTRTPATGIVIQAGSKPRLGDVNRGDIPEAYRAVARLTAPLRLETFDPRFGLLRLRPPFDPAEESLRWVRRFD